MGVRVRMAVRESRSATLQLTRPDRRPLAVGSVVRLASGRTFPVGYDGVAYLTELTENNRAEVLTPDGACEIAFPFAPARSQNLEIGPVVCRPR